MAALDHIARSVLRGDALEVRSLIQDELRARPHLRAWAKPDSNDGEIMAIAAGIVELLAMRAAEPAPSWSADVGPLEKPIYLVKSARIMPRLRRLCEEESPLPLRRRRLFAPPDFLTFA